MIDELALAVGIAQGPPVPPKFPAVRCLLIQPGPPPPSDDRCGTPFEEYGMALSQLEAFTEKCRNAGLKATILPACQERFRATGVHRLREEWLNGEERARMD